MITLPNAGMAHLNFPPSGLVVRHMGAGWRDLMGQGADRAQGNLDPEAEVVRQNPQRKERSQMAEDLGEGVACLLGKEFDSKFPR